MTIGDLIFLPVIIALANFIAGYILISIYVLIRKSVWY